MTSVGLAWESSILHSMRALRFALVCLAFTGSLSTQIATSHYDNARTGANLNEKVLTPKNVNANEFGKLFAFFVDGDVYAQPLFLPHVSIPGQGEHDVIFVATEQRLRVRRGWKACDCIVESELRRQRPPNIASAR